MSGAALDLDFCTCAPIKTKAQQRDLELLLAAKQNSQLEDWSKKRETR